MACAPATWVEIDLAAIEQNVRALRGVTRPGVRFMAVVKANGYGHGAVEVARRALAAGADALGVARVTEGIQLRQAGIDAPVLIFGFTPPDAVETLLQWNLTQTIYDLRAAKDCSDAALSAGKPLRIHLKIDTGMGRLGLVAFGRSGEQDHAVRTAVDISRMPGLELEGVFTHFAASDSADKTFSVQQFRRFTDFLDRLQAEGVDIPVRHSANSAGIMELPDAHLDMVRAGIALYGLYPSDEVSPDRVTLKPAMAFKARVIHLKPVPAGFSVSYGMTWRTPEPTTVATVAAGYADGLDRLLSNRGEMLVRGCRAPIIGRVCMDLTMLNVGHIPDVTVGDEVVIFGRQGTETITVDEVAASLGTINYEVVSTITGRVPRIYLQ